MGACEGAESRDGDNVQVNRSRMMIKDRDSSVAGSGPDLVVVVAQRPAQLVVVHVVLVLAQPPQPRHLLGVLQLELAVLARPGDEVALALVLQQVEQELPQRDGGVHG